MRIVTFKASGDCQFLESEIDEWLEDNPQIKVSHVKQSAYIDDRGYDSVFISIWYEEPAPTTETDPLLSKVFAKYIRYIKDVEGGDYILTHSERHASSVVFTDEEWELLTQVAKNRETNGKN